MDPVIASFKQEFDRFHGFLEQLIEACPDALWTDNTGNMPYWLHLLHTFASYERYVAPYDAAPQQTFFTQDVINFKVAPDRVISKAEVRSFAAAMKAVVHAFLATQNAETLTAKNETMSRSLKKECINLNAMVALIRHPSYHIGCCDTVLRANGIAGVY